MIFKVGQYLEFENAVAKITKIGDNPNKRKINLTYPGDGMVKMRRMTAGEGWDYQHVVSLEHLQKLYKENKCRIIDYLTILRLLSDEKRENGDII